MLFYFLNVQNSALLGATTSNGEWQPGIGDPTFMGWLTVFAYLATGVLCIICAKETFRIPDRYQFHDYHWFWWGLALIFLVLGINKQLDLQTWFTITAKKFALRGGWYGDRRLFQALFIGWLIFGLLAFLAWFKKYFRRMGKEFKFILYGLAFLSAFIVIRATSFHHVDQLLRVNLLGFKMNWILELGGIFSIAFGSIKYLENLRKIHAELDGLDF
jgi:hypothetical protein